MKWPLKKLYEYMAFYHLESEEYKAAQKKDSEPMSFDEICMKMEAEGMFK